MTLRAVLLDMGGVLLDTHNVQGLPQGRLDYRGREAMLRALEAGGGRATPEILESELFGPWRREYERRYELGREASWTPHLRRLRRTTGARVEGRRLLAAWFEPYAETLTPIPGAAAALAALRARELALAVVSNVPLPGGLYRRVLHRHGLDAGIASFQWSYDAGSRKPSPALLGAALMALGAAPGEAVMVGDRRGSDVAAARAAGVTSVWLRREHRQGPAPDHTIDDMAELPALLGRLDGSPGGPNP